MQHLPGTGHSSHPVSGRAGAGLWQRSGAVRKFMGVTLGGWVGWWWGGGKDCMVHRETNPSSPEQEWGPRPLCGGGTPWAAVPPPQLQPLSQTPPDGWSAVRTAQGKAPGALLPGTPGGAALGQQADVGTCAGSARAPSLWSGPVGVHLWWLLRPPLHNRHREATHGRARTNTHPPTHSPPFPPRRSCKCVQPAKCETSGEAWVCADLETL